MTAPFFNPINHDPTTGVPATLLFQTAPQGFVASADSFYANSQDGQPGFTGPVALSLDIISSESPSWTAQPTENPLENGVTISDHVRVLPRKLEIEAMVSSVIPFSPRAGILVSSTNPVIDTLNFLDAAVVAATPFDFVSGLAVYRNMVITSLKVDRKAATSKAAKFTMTMQEVLIVSTQFVTIQQNTVEPDIAPITVSTANFGKATPTPANSSQTAAATGSFSKTSDALPGGD